MINRKNFINDSRLLMQFYNERRELNVTHRIKY